MSLLPIVQVLNVSKRYKDLTVLDNITFDIFPCEIVTLVGANGSGKSTIARIILGVDKPTAGKVIIAHKVIMSYVPQKVRFGQNPNMPLTCRDYILHTRPEILFSNSNTNTPAQELLYDFGLYGILDRQISALSGGELQKLLLCVAVAAMPNLLVLDEPTSCLDIDGQSALYEVLEYLRAQYGMAIFMISHDLHTVSSFSDRVLCVNKHICCSGIVKKSDVIEENIWQGQQHGNLSELHIHSKELTNQFAIYKHNHDHTHLRSDC